MAASVAGSLSLVEVGRQLPKTLPQHSNLVHSLLDQLQGLWSLAAGASRLTQQPDRRHQIGDSGGRHTLCGVDTELVTLDVQPDDPYLGTLAQDLAQREREAGLGVVILYQDKPGLQRAKPIVRVFLPGIDQYRLAPLVAQQASDSICEELVAVEDERSVQFSRTFLSVLRQRPLLQLAAAQSYLRAPGTSMYLRYIYGD